MKKTVMSMVVTGFVTFVFICGAGAATLDEAKSLGVKAAAYVKKVGKDDAAKELNTPGNQFDKGEMYVTLHNTGGVFLANPKVPAMAGQNHLNLKDPTGKPFVQEMISIAKSPAGSGWLTYTWSNPATKKAQSKKAWVQRVEGTDMFTLSGLFQ
jgi:cytochrome c